MTLDTRRMLVTIAAVCGVLLVAFGVEIIGPLGVLKGLLAVLAVMGCVWGAQQSIPKGKR